LIRKRVLHPSEGERGARGGGSCGERMRVPPIGKPEKHGGSTIAPAALLLSPGNGAWLRRYPGVQRRNPSHSASAVSPKTPSSE
jgi:hypothetical protein